MSGTPYPPSRGLWYDLSILSLDLSELPFTQKGVRVKLRLSERG